VTIYRDANLRSLIGVRQTKRAGERECRANTVGSAALAVAILFQASVVAIPAASQGPVPAAAALAPTPPMGWASWNRYFCDYDEQTIRDQADALVATGMRDLGYRYVIIQECIAPNRDATGNLVVDAKRFPHGIGALADYIHSRGLKAGIYTDVGPFTCFPNPRFLGSYNHEDQDAATFASWGIDLIEVDFCNKPEDHTGTELYKRMAAGIRRTGRPVLLYICSWGKEAPWEWAHGVGQFWRTTGDISYQKNHVKWDDIVRNFESNAQDAGFNGPDSWNDPDMLEVGNAGITAVEARSHFSMWVISAAPLLAGTDLVHMDSETRATFTNPEVIAVDQDPLGAGPSRIRLDQKAVEVWEKPLGSKSSGTKAVLLLNLSSTKAVASVRWSDLRLMPNATVRDLWSRKDLGQFTDGYSAEIPPHGAMLLKVSGKGRENSL
jgi:alpha-galactosidase